jgi:hypothetical protein
MVEGRLRALVAPTRRSILAVLAAGAARPAWAQSNSRSLTFSSDADLLRFPGALNGHPVTIMLDSGAGNIVIDRKLAARIGLASTGDQSTAGGLTGVQTIERSNPFQLSFAGVTLNANGGALADLGAFAQTGEEVPVILGRQAFEPFAVEIDFPTHRLTLYRPGQFDATGARRLVLRREAGGTTSVQISLEGKDPVWANFDLGSNTPLSLKADYARSIGLLDNRPASTWIAAQVEGIVTYDVATARTVSFGGVEISDVPFDSTARWRADNPVAANIGFPLISRLGRVIVDYASGALYVFPPTTAPAPFHKDRLGLALAPVPGGGWRVMHVAAASPGAAAGWKIGDEIAAVNGLSAMTLTQRRALFGDEPGAKVTLARRGGESTTLELKTYY